MWRIGGSLSKATCTAASAFLITLFSSVCTNASAVGFDWFAAFTAVCSRAAARLARLLWREALGGRGGGGGGAG